MARPETVSLGGLEVGWSETRALSASRQDGSRGGCAHFPERAIATRGELRPFGGQPAPALPGLGVTELGTDAPPGVLQWGQDWGEARRARGSPEGVAGGLLGRGGVELYLLFSLYFCIQSTTWVWIPS